ncbi:MAG: phasin family protein [Curvibacter sp.]
MPSKPTASDQPPGAEAARDSAHQIWLAGLGAFTRAQQEGSKVFDALVQEGLAMQRKAQSTAEARLAEASQKVSHLAQEFSQRATGQWNQLEGLFEERVARALERLGMPTAQQVQALQARIDALEAQRKTAAPRPAAKKATPARKAAPKTAPRTARKAPAKTSR